MDNVRVSSAREQSDVIIVLVTRTIVNRRNRRGRPCRQFVKKNDVGESKTRHVRDPNNGCSRFDPMIYFSSYSILVLVFNPGEEGSADTFLVQVDFFPVRCNGFTYKYPYVYINYASFIITKKKTV